MSMNWNVDCSRKWAGKICSVIVVVFLAPFPLLAMPVTDIEVSSSGDYALFRLVFADTPDFNTVDQAGRQKDEFQFYIDAANPIGAGSGVFGAAVRGIYPDVGLSIIRGGEIFKTGKIVVRDVEPNWTPPPGELGTGGWGPRVAEVNFLQLANVVSFRLPLAAIQSETGRFYWNLLTVRFGATDAPRLFGSSRTVVPIDIIDIKPGSDPNSINLKSKGKIPVAILTTDTFDATQVDWETALFGPDGATESHGRAHIKDVDGDGDMDLVLHFNTQETGIDCGDTEATLTGMTFDGQAITGVGAIETVNCPE